MNMKQVIFLMMLLFCALYGCTKQEIEVFSTDDAGIYFQSQSVSSYGSSENYTDSMSFSFASVEASMESVIVYAPVRTMGKVRNYDRPFKVIVDKERTTAIEGVHYEVNLDTLYVPAGESRANVPVRLLRAADLVNKTVTLVLRLQDNEHFVCYLEEYKNTNSYTATGELISGVTYSFSVNEMYTEPQYWAFFGGFYFGDWTPRKYLIVNAVCGLSPEDWENAGLPGSKVSFGRFGFFTKLVQAYLQEQGDAGTPERNPDGSFIQLAQGYEVDYSQYE